VGYYLYLRTRWGYFKVTAGGGILYSTSETVKKLPIIVPLEKIITF
jgi:hypothetical protein